MARSKEFTKSGPRSAYDPKFDQIVLRALRLKHDLTTAQLAELLGVSTSAFSAWLVRHPSLKEAMHAGKDAADEQVAQSLYTRAVGYSHPDVDIRVLKDRNGEQYIVQTPIVRHYPPDTTAAVWWLKNRQGQHWREKQEIAHTGNLTVVMSDEDASVV